VIKKLIDILSKEVSISIMHCSTTQIIILSIVADNFIQERNYLNKNFKWKN